MAASHGTLGDLEAWGPPASTRKASEAPWAAPLMPGGPLKRALTTRAPPFQPTGETPRVNVGIDISPMRMLYREYQEEWTSFLTQTCAVVGGVFTVFGMVVALLDTGAEALSKKTI